VLPGEFLLGLGLGFVFVPLQNVALLGITHDDAGVASAVLNATNQIGGSLGTALLNSVAITATAGYVTDHALHGPSPKALTHGYDVGFYVSAGLLAVGAVLIAIFITAKGTDMKDVDAPGAAI
jgi:hypothetical protein